VDVRAQVRGVVSEEMEPGGRREGPGAEQRHERDQPIAKEEPHRVGIGRGAASVKGPAA
jgi:hypothetical protein